MRHLVIAGITGLAVCGVTYAAMAGFSSEDWRQDLLTLQAVPEPPPEVAPRKGKAGRRGGRRKAKATSPSKGRPSAARITPDVPAKSETPGGRVAATAGKTAGRSKADEHYLRSGAYLKEKKVGLAIQELERCLAADPNYALAYRSLGIAQTLLGRERKATEYFEKFVKLAPKHRDAARIKEIIADYHRRNPK